MGYGTLQPHILQSHSTTPCKMHLLSKMPDFLQRITVPAGIWLLLTEPTQHLSLFTVSHGQRCSWDVREKKGPVSCPVGTHALQAGLTLSPTLCGLGGKRHTYSSVSLGEPSQTQVENRYYIALLSRRANNTFLVYSGSLCTLQNQHKKP